MRNSADSRSKAQWLRDVAENKDFLEVGRKAIEDALVDFRDDRLSTFRGNGFVICERDGRPSDVIRFGPETGVSIALRAIAAAMDKGNSPTKETPLA